MASCGKQQCKVNTFLSYIHFFTESLLNAQTMTSLETVLVADLDRSNKEAHHSQDIDYHRNHACKRKQTLNSSVTVFSIEQQSDQKL